MGTLWQAFPTPMGERGGERRERTPLRSYGTGTRWQTWERDGKRSLRKLPVPLTGTRNSVEYPRKERM
ncbi:MAG TPA: hypothetical protein VF932_13525 [Anaerolineae bacterium]